jgi:GrpB-like predicted nucleotidyltransferase (UPF0157 family)
MTLATDRVAMTGIILKKSDELLPQVEPIVARLFARIEVLVADAELHHIGSTAIPGSATKGDIDILFRVEQSCFESVKDVLGKHFVIKQPVNWTADFASFGDDTTYGIPVGIQLVSKDSISDFFLYLRDYLLTHPEAAEEYNRIKMAHAAAGADQYWKAKDAFLAKILAARSRSSPELPDPSPDAMPGSVTQVTGQTPSPRN